MYRPGASAVGAFLGVISLGLTAWAILGRVEPLGIPFDAPEKVSYYRWTVALLVLASVSGAFAIAMGIQANRRAMTARWTGLGVSLLGGGGLSVGVGLLLILTGLCGPSVLWGYCQG